MHLKKRYFLFLLPVLLFAMCKSELMTFRRSDARIARYLEKRGQEAPRFFTIEKDGRSIHYTQVGDTTKPLVLLVHGAPGSASAFLTFLADTQLTRFAQVIAVDRPGNGFSDFGRSEPSLKLQAAALAPILQRHRSSKAIVMGHSYGGPVVARLAMDYPDLVDGVFIMAGSIDPELEPREWWRKYFDSPWIRWILPTSMVVANQEIHPLYSELKAMLPGWASITCPVTVVQGTKDTLVPAGNADFARRMAVNSSRLDIRMIEGGSHFILWSKQRYMVEVLREMTALP
ncbi:MAG: alpha/beta hydrolase [Lewinellaceae bacterium]|nr:alpha/beta hydrolase [Lewinellaceae bacterium]